MHVELVDSMGNDLSVVNAARVSFDKFKEEFDESDEKLIKYLATHNHFTPFTQVTYQVRITCPIFVARQWWTHKIGISRNEVSRRYVSDEPDFWGIDDIHSQTTTSNIVWRKAPSKNVKQGSGEAFDDLPQTAFNAVYTHAMQRALQDYNWMIDEGVAPEQARSILPTAMETSWIETGSLSAAARICGLRFDSHAQVEICELAKEFGALVGSIAPVSWKYLVEV